MPSRRNSLRKSVRKSVKKSMRKSVNKSMRKRVKKSMRKGVKKSVRKGVKKSMRKRVKKSMRKRVRFGFYRTEINPIKDVEWNSKLNLKEISESSPGSYAINKCWGKSPDEIIQIMNNILQERETKIWKPVVEARRKLREESSAVKDSLNKFIVKGINKLSSGSKDKKELRYLMTSFPSKLEIDGANKINLDSNLNYCLYKKNDKDFKMYLSERDGKDCDKCGKIDLEERDLTSGTFGYIWNTIETLLKFMYTICLIRKLDITGQEKLINRPSEYKNYLIFNKPYSDVDLFLFNLYDRIYIGKTLKI